MNWKRATAETIASCSALGRMLAGRRCGFRILLYHAIGSRLEHDSYGMSIRPDLFERHVAILAKTRWANVEDLSEGQESRHPLRIAVTLDDGYKDTLEVAAPILQKYKIPFTVFVTTSFIESKKPIFLTRAELRELAVLPGVKIGSHGVTHIPLADCDDSTLWRELADSRRLLEDMIGKPVTSISYPHGSANRRVAAAAKRAGYTLGACSRFDINDASRDPFLLCRTEVVSSDSERGFLQKLQGAWDWHRWRSKDPATMA